MSLNSWKKEFYKVPASTKMSKKEAVKHSLLKWRGLLKKNLNKHNLFVTKDGDLVDDETLYNEELFLISDVSCALCEKFMTGVLSSSGCQKCPLSQVRGDVECTGKEAHEDFSPFERWLKYKNPKPMIRWLEKTLKFVEGK